MNLLLGSCFEGGSSICARPPQEVVADEEEKRGGVSRTCTVIMVQTARLHGGLIGRGAALTMRGVLEKQVLNMLLDVQRAAVAELENPEPVLVKPTAAEPTCGPPPNADLFF